MGTNFYVRGWGKADNDMDPKYHIGKRSAAGLYCWDCGVTLCKGGNVAIHLDVSKWFDKCPKCGKAPQRESLFDGPAGRELGFNRKPFGKKTGVCGCSSFNWAMDPDKFRKRKGSVWDEYGNKFSIEEFWKMLEECPIQYKSIGEWFS